ncbi:hypothetical protein LAZ67_18000989 [Cordylochernes scorpioides]|uniref:Reverse transcriptase domain-containing protein n=1 Tax=Cordylochernes scorpioides TaxID=51811 RepID=A0ABY6LK71_9ARAC|nr:hypothetical protein LAZ67_18000989 [Cordylochernes scorpioides]
MEGHILVGLSSVQLAEKLIEEGLKIKDVTLRAFPLRKRAERNVVGNVLFFVEGSDRVTVLRPYEQVTSIIQNMIQLEDSSWADARREAFITLRDVVKLSKIPARLDVKAKGVVTHVYVTYDIKCSLCYKKGHKRANCPRKTGLQEDKLVIPLDAPASRTQGWTRPPSTSNTVPATAPTPGSSPAPTADHTPAAVDTAPPPSRAFNYQQEDLTPKPIPITSALKNLEQKTSRKRRQGPVSRPLSSKPMPYNNSAISTPAAELCAPINQTLPTVSNPTAPTPGAKIPVRLNETPAPELPVPAPSTSQMPSRPEPSSANTEPLAAPAEEIQAMTESSIQSATPADQDISLSRAIQEREPLENFFEQLKAYSTLAPLYGFEVEYGDYTLIPKGQRILDIASDEVEYSSGVINMSSTKLSVEEERILSLGLRFVPPNKSIPDIPKIIAGVEGAIRSLNHVETLKVRNAVTQVLYRSTQQTVPSNRYHSTINRLRKSRSIVIIKSDKGNQTVILDSAEYKKKMLEILTDEDTFKLIPEKEKILLIKYFEKSLINMKNSSFITADQFTQFTSSLDKNAYIYGSPKIHKPGVPLRPIIAYHLSPAFPVAKFLVSILSPIRNNSPNIYSITNPPNFIEDISSLSPPPQHIMASFDITSLYLSLPYSLITERVYTPFLVQQLTKLCLSMGTFTFQKQYYSQIRGTPMGSPLSSIISEIVLGFLDRWINLTLPSDIYYWRRYVDDIFCIIKSDSLHLIHSTLHSFNSHIKFTYEAEQNCVLPFLDILIIRTPYKFHFTVYYKKTIYSTTVYPFLLQ